MQILEACLITEPQDQCWDPVVGKALCVLLSRLTLPVYQASLLMRLGVWDEIKMKTELVK